jgi:hypothetical protein
MKLYANSSGDTLGRNTRKRRMATSSTITPCLKRSHLVYHSAPPSNPYDLPCLSNLSRPERPKHQNQENRKRTRKPHAKKVPNHRKAAEPSNAQAGNDINIQRPEQSPHPLRKRMSVKTTSPQHQRTAVFMLHFRFLALTCCAMSRISSKRLGVQALNSTRSSNHATPFPIPTVLATKKLGVALLGV